MSGIGSHQKPNRGATDDWLTPLAMIRSLGKFDLDPACPVGMPWRTAEKMLTPLEDGLAQNWNGRVWLNPPYGPQTGKWLKRLAEHPDGGTALIFARIETDAWKKWVWSRAQAILFLEWRIHFHRLDGSRAPHNSGAPSALVAYGNADTLALCNSGLAGQLVFGWRPL